MNNQEIKVSICCITYNHEKYVRDTIEGFIHQKTDFPVEIIIHDDASTDSTPEIIKEYADKDDRIIPILRKDNIKSTGRPVFPIIYEKARGFYIAQCEGDDFWTDEYKIQKQVNKLENNPDCDLCFHPAMMMKDEISTDSTMGNIGDTTKTISLETLFDLGITKIPTCSMVFRKDLFNGQNIKNFIFEYGSSVTNKILATYRGGAIYHPEIMGAYRVNAMNSHSQRVSKDGKAAFESLVAVNEALDKVNKLTNKKYSTQIESYKVQRILNSFKKNKNEELRSLIENRYLSEYPEVINSDHHRVQKRSWFNQKLHNINHRLSQVYKKPGELRRKISKKIRNKISTSYSFYLKSDFRIRIYYAFIDSSFIREFRTVLFGKQKHLNDLDQNDVNRYFLTRSVHRIEKGLTMEDRKSIFALDYIEKAVTAYRDLIDQSYSFDTQISWYSDVLNMYFESAGQHPVIDRSKKIFFEGYNKYLDEHKNGKLYPYKWSSKNYELPSYEHMYNLAQRRRSVRWFKDKPVDRELIDKAIQIAKLSPSACNRQPFYYRILDDDELKVKAAAIPMGTKGYADNIPVFLVTVGDLSAYFDERDRHLIYIDASLANMSLMFALETLGLSSCPINWPDIEEKEVQMSELLNLKSYERPVMCMAIGYAKPDGLVAHSEKKDIETIRKYN